MRWLGAGYQQSGLYHQHKNSGRNGDSLITTVDEENLTIDCVNCILTNTYNSRRNNSSLGQDDEGLKMRW